MAIRKKARKSEGPAPSRLVIPRGERLDQAILTLRGQRVMLDADLAALYGVETRALVQAVRRNLSRFPGDFMFRLGETEWDILKSQIVMSSSGWGGRRKLPYAFTQEGIAMLSSVLRSDRAVRVNVEIMRAFARFRRLLGEDKDLAERMASAESRLDGHDAILRSHKNTLGAAITQLDRLLAAPPEKPPSKPAIGFRPPKSSGETKAKARKRG